MRCCVYAVIAVLLLSLFALGRGGQRGARRMMIAAAHVRLSNVQNVPDLMRFVRHPYDSSVSASSVSSSSTDASPMFFRMPSAAEPIPSGTPLNGSAPGQLKLMDSAGDIIRCGNSPSSGCLSPAQNYRTYVAY